MAFVDCDPQRNGRFEELATGLLAALPDVDNDGLLLIGVNRLGAPFRRIFRQTDLLQTLQKLVDSEAQALKAGKSRKEAIYAAYDRFYKGDIAKSIDGFMKANGGYLRYEDFASHKSDWVEPVSVNYRGYDVWELPPNGQGIAALQMLQILKNFDLKAMGYNSVESIHTLVEAKKLAFEDRAKFYADTDFNKLPIKGLISEAYGKERAKLIGANAAQRVDAGNPAAYEGDTIYMTTADKDGTMVSLIQSNYRGMGSGVVAPGTGFGFQDRGQMFSMDQKHANAYEPGVGFAWQSAWNVK